MSMEIAYKIAADAVKRRFAEQKPAYLEALNRIGPSDVAVYTGQFDQADKVLKLLKIPVRINPGMDNLQAKVVIANCGSSHHPYLYQVVKRLVESGSTFIGSDWALDEIVEKAFPDKVKWDRTKTTGSETVSIEADQDSTWGEVVVPGVCPQWPLWGSHPITVVDEENVTVEAASTDMLLSYGESTIAVRFEIGKGSVHQVVAHFWAKNSATPTSAHRGPADDFLRRGMQLSEDAVADLMSTRGASSLSFGAIQSAATATELVAQKCAEAMM